LLETLSQLSDDEDEDEPVLAGYSQDPYADLELWRLYESKSLMKKHYELYYSIMTWRLFGIKTFESLYQADAKDKWWSEDSELLLRYCSEVMRSIKLLQNVELLPIQELLVFHCSEGTWYIELLLLSRITSNYCCQQPRIIAAEYWIITYLTVQKDM